ncbi:MAG: flagellar basal body L-ring protein FlgH [Planctomycetota bacterium]
MSGSTERAATLTAALALLGGVLPAQNLYRSVRNPRSPIADLRAGRVGDILTISVQEAHSITNEDRVDRNNQTSLAARLEDYTLSEHTFKTNILPKIDVRQERDFQGEARQEKDSNIQASIAVIVVDVQPNGNLVVAGSRVVNVDDETKTLRISGIVRPLDIAADNTVRSTQVADARLSVTGEGANTRVTTRGPVAQVFDTMVWLAWPF